MSIFVLFVSARVLFEGAFSLLVSLIIQFYQNQSSKKNYLFMIRKDRSFVGQIVQAVAVIDNKIPSSFLSILVVLFSKIFSIEHSTWPVAFQQY